jgi:16S rRNA (cytosine967-C5)-methyltransferase
VLAVCSVLREEAEEVVARVIEANADAGSADAGSAPSGARRVELVPAPFESDVVRRISGFGEVAATDAGVGDAAGITAARLLPHVHGTDGYFIASFEVRSR